MMPYFAAAGHNNYLKSTCIHIRNMIALNKTHPNAYYPFLEGHHVASASASARSAHSFDLDGLAIINRIPWTKNETYASIFATICKYIKTKYGDRPTIVYDGYGQPSTKDIAHLKRTRSIGKEVDFTSEMKCTTTKEEFLSSSKNKTQFIKNF